MTPVLAAVLAGVGVAAATSFGGESEGDAGVAQTPPPISEEVEIGSGHTRSGADYTVSGYLIANDGLCVTVRSSGSNAQGCGPLAGEKKAALSVATFGQDAIVYTVVRPGVSSVDVLVNGVTAATPQVGATRVGDVEFGIAHAAVTIPVPPIKDDAKAPAPPELPIAIDARDSAGNIVEHDAVGRVP